MKKNSSLVFFFVCGFIISLFCFVGASKAENQNTSSQSVESDQAAGYADPQRETRQIVMQVRTKLKIDFAGTVNSIDPASATLSVRNQGKTISFDMSRVILIGYENIAQIKSGDKVSVGYTPYGLQIRKGILPITHRDAPPRQAALQMTAPIGITDKRYPKSFNNIDNNKDGKITPIELSVMVTDLTIEQFIKYDKNGDGCLNRPEFNTVKKTK